MIKTLEKENIADIVKKTNLQHIAIIMDGNRRWAKERNLPSAMGHKEGPEALKRAVKACHKFGIEYLTVYAFSTENWNRSKEEVDFLMQLFINTFKNEFDELNKNNVVLNFIGNLKRLNPKLQKVLQDAVEKTKNNTFERAAGTPCWAASAIEGFSELKVPNKVLLDPVLGLTRLLVLVIKLKEDIKTLL